MDVKLFLGFLFLAKIRIRCSFWYFSKTKTIKSFCIFWQTKIISLTFTFGLRKCENGKINSKTPKIPLDNRDSIFEKLFSEYSQTIFPSNIKKYLSSEDNLEYENYENTSRL